jgi:S1-C subfamily serine protease
MLECLRKMGWLTNYAKATLSEGQEKLLSARLVETFAGSLKLTALGAQLWADERYVRYLGTASARAEYWRQSNARLFVPDNTGIGSGFFVGPRTLVTARHVVEDLGSLRYQIVDEAGQTYLPRCEELHPDSDIDLACVHVESEFVGRPMLLGTGPRLLEEVVAFGYPPVAQLTDILLCTRGEVAAITRAVYGRGPDVFLLSCLMRPGNSGGPVIGESGLVIGIVARNLHHQTPQTADGTDVHKALGVATAFPARYLRDIPGVSQVGG